MPPRPSGSIADGLEPDPVDARAPAGGDEQAVAAQLAAVVEFEDVLVARRGARRSRARAECAARCPPRAQNLAAAPRPSGAGSRGSTWSAPSTSATSPPRRRTACAISTPTGPPPRISSRCGTAFIAVTSRFVQTPVELAQAGDRRDDRVGAGGEDDVLGACSASPSTSTTPGRRAGRCRAAGRCRVGQPARLPVVGVVGDHEVAPRERRVDVDVGRRPPPRAGRLARRVDRLARPQQRLGRDAAPSSEHSPPTSSRSTIGDPQAAVGQRAGTVLAPAGRPR